jgi:uncharacterized protein YraI
MNVLAAVKSARKKSLAILLSCLTVSHFSEANSPDDTVATTVEGSHQTTVADAFLEMRTGPGRGYPVFHVAEQGEVISVTRRRTDWFKVTTNTRPPKAGWVHISQMVRTVDDSGDLVKFSHTDLASVADRRWEWSMSGGDFQGASAISSSVTYRFNRNIALQVQASQILGDVSDGMMLVVSIQHSPFPHWRLSPYFQLGTGVLHTEPFSTIVQSDDRTNQTINAGAGVNYYLVRRFLVFLDYRYHNVLTSRNENEEISEWKLGVSVFF